jgi:MFS transporter, OCT family, solute carrier family 22 (organic cation transporter), member 13
MEYLRPSLRSIGLNLAVGVFYTIGCVSLPWLTHVAGHWRNFLFLIACPAFILPVVPFLVPESARWALASGKGPHSALSSMQKIAKFNGKKLLPEDEADFLVYISFLHYLKFH